MDILWYTLYVLSGFIPWMITLKWQSIQFKQDIYSDDMIIAFLVSLVFGPLFPIIIGLVMLVIAFCQYLNKKKFVIFEGKGKK
jgi:uncharacterized membrane protein